MYVAGFNLPLLEILLSLLVLVLIVFIESMLLSLSQNRLMVSQQAVLQEKTPLFALRPGATSPSVATEIFPSGEARWEKKAAEIRDLLKEIQNPELSVRKIKGKNPAVQMITSLPAASEVKRTEVTPKPRQPVVLPAPSGVELLERRLSTLDQQLAGLATAQKPLARVLLSLPKKSAISDSQKVSQDPPRRAPLLDRLFQHTTSAPPPAVPRKEVQVTESPFLTRRLAAVAQQLQELEKELVTPQRVQVSQKKQLQREQKKVPVLFRKNRPADYKDSHLGQELNVLRKKIAAL